MKSRDALPYLLQAHLTESSEVDYPDGWFDLVLHCNKEVNKLYPEYVIVRIVEESGELHFEVGPVPNELAVSMQYLSQYYRAMSRQSCQRCGNFAALRNISGEDITLCTPHWQMAQREAVRKGAMYGK